METLEREGRLFTAYLLELENAIIGFFCEGEAVKLGTLALALPQRFPSPGQPASSLLIGYRSSNIARISAEYLANKTGKIAVASVFLRKDEDLEGGKAVLDLVKKLCPEG